MKTFDVHVTKKVVETYRVQARNHGEAMVKVGSALTDGTQPVETAVVDTRVARPNEVKDDAQLELDADKS